ncbi:hypothetical protein [Elizabethkingia meningoseptica]|uniref:hypothetical protein n=1 Tax=Elizabethkingia meningoseptica TaxID=238 RepID=UPI0023B1CB4D|nr:hypothetical protein [Elizabethkingia meningoseptica]MDE5525707.1 hypothetical protein [Elizabethkingia meningoseptica]
MSKVPKSVLQDKFESGNKPKQRDFFDWMDSYHHKDETIPLTNIGGLSSALDGKLDRGAESTLIEAFDQKIKEAENIVNKAYLGLAKSGSTAPNLGAFWFKVEDGYIDTFTNLKDAQGVAVFTIAEDFKKDNTLYDVTIEVKDGIAKKTISEKLVNPVKKEFDASDNINSVTMKALSGRYDVRYPFTDFDYRFPDIYAIKEIYLENYSGNFDYYIGTLRKNVNNYWFIKIIKTTAGTNNYPTNYVSQIILEETNPQSGITIHNLKENNIVVGKVAIDWDSLANGYQFDRDPDSKYKLSTKMGDLNANPLIKSDIERISTNSKIDNIINAYPLAKLSSTYPEILAIKEIYLENYSGNFDYYIGTLRKNVNNYWFIKIIKTTAGTNNYPTNYVSQIILEETNPQSGITIHNLKENNIVVGKVVINWDILVNGYEFDKDPNIDYKLVREIGDLNANIIIKTEIEKIDAFSKTETDNRYAKKGDIPSGMITEESGDQRYAFKNDEAYSKTETDSKYALIGSLSASSNKFVDAADFGFLPTKTASENVTALQNALNGGNKTLTVSIPGVYDLNARVFIDDNTHIIFGAGVILRKAAYYDFVLINRGAATRTWNENITVENLTISYNGYDWMEKDPNSPFYGLRGFLTFWFIRKLKVKNYTCKNYSDGQWALQIADFYDFIVDGVEIDGHKDGIHLGRGKKFVIRNVKSKCYDDTIALNSFDYPQSNPTIGDIEDGLIEMIDDNYNNTWDNGSRFTLLLVGTPVAWRTNIPIKNGDAVTYNGKTYIALTGTTTGQEFISVTFPNAEYDAVQATPEGIKWRKIDSTAVQSANIKNVTYRNINHNFPVSGWLAMFLIDEEGAYSRSLHPEVPADKMPYAENIVFENIKSPMGVIKFNNKYKYSAIFRNINGRKAGSTLFVGETNIGSRALVDNCELRDDSNHWLGSGVDYTFRDCPTTGTPNISMSGRLRTNISVNHGDLSLLTPQRGDEITINGIKKIYTGSNWKNLN